MNELFFFLQIGAILGAIFWAHQSGKEALVAICVLLAICANFFVLKQITLFGWNVTSSDAFAIGNIFCLNLIQKRYGKTVALQAIGVSFFGMLLFTLLSQIHLLYVPSIHDTSHSHFEVLLSGSPRLLVASLLTFFVVQQIDVWLYGFLQRRYSRASSPLRNTLSLMCSQAVDTALFSFLGLYGVVQELGSMMVVSYLVKSVVIVFIFFTTPPLFRHAV